MGPSRHDALATVCRHHCDLAGCSFWRPVSRTLEAGGASVLYHCFPWRAGCHDQRRSGRSILFALQPATLLPALATPSGLTHRRTILLFLTWSACFVDRDGLDLDANFYSLR